MPRALAFGGPHRVYGFHPSPVSTHGIHRPRSSQGKGLLATLTKGTEVPWARKGKTGPKSTNAGAVVASNDISGPVFVFAGACSPGFLGVRPQSKFSMRVGSQRLSEQ